MRISRNLLPLAGIAVITFCLASCSHPSPKVTESTGVANASAHAAEAPASPAVSSASLPAAPLTGSSLWRSETTGNEYRVTIHGDRLVADWVNVPPIAARRGSYIHTVCTRKGHKWVGTSSIFLACSLGQGAQTHIANTCLLRMKIEFDTVTQNLITGRGQGLTKFDCRTCKVIEAGWGNFKWVPVR